MLGVRWDFVGPIMILLTLEGLFMGKLCLLFPDYVVLFR
jgi:hypothetical protein